MRAKAVYTSGYEHHEGDSFSVKDRSLWLIALDR